MHDPESVAHEIKLFGHYFITIWHVDPMNGGDEDSCGWAWPHLSDREVGYAAALIDNEYDNLKSWFPDMPEYEAKSRIRRLFRLHKGLSRKWWQHPRWHFWHWRFQVHPLQKFKRWAFSRCHYCGGRFAWNESVLGLQWYGTGPGWFRNNEKIAHSKCHYEAKAKTPGEGGG
jgi:hypothetical protein